MTETGENTQIIKEESSELLNKYNSEIERQIPGVGSYDSPFQLDVSSVISLKNKAPKGIVAELEKIKQKKYICYNQRTDRIGLSCLEQRTGKNFLNLNSRSKPPVPQDESALGALLSLERPKKGLPLRNDTAQLFSGIPILGYMLDVLRNHSQHREQRIGNKDTFFVDFEGTRMQVTVSNKTTDVMVLGKLTPTYY